MCAEQKMGKMNINEIFSDGCNGKKNKHKTKKQQINNPKKYKKKTTTKTYHKSAHKETKYKTCAQVLGEKCI